MVKVSLQASVLSETFAKSLTLVMEYRNGRKYLEKYQNPNDVMKQKTMSTAKTIAVIQHAGTLTKVIEVRPGVFCNVGDYRGPKNLMSLAGLKRIYRNSVAINRAKPCVEVEIVDDLPEVEIMTPDEFNQFWSDFNDNQQHKVLDLAEVTAEDVTIEDFAAAYVNEVNNQNFVAIGGRLDANLTRLLGVVVPGDSEEFYQAVVPTDEEVERWLVTYGNTSTMEK